MELQIPFYGIQVGWFTALPGETRRIYTIAFAVYRFQAGFTDGVFDGKCAAIRHEGIYIQTHTGARDN